MVYYGKVTSSYLQYFVRYELFSPILVKSRQTIDYRQKAMHKSPPSNLHRWAQLDLFEGKKCGSHPVKGW